jgi:hypothetical protein
MLMRICANKLCIPTSYVCLLFLQEAHGVGLMGYFGVKKIEDVLAAHFFWPKMRRDVGRYVSRCTACNKSKSRLNPHGVLHTIVSNRDARFLSLF